MRFKQFEIRKPTLLIEPEDKDYYKYNFDLVKWGEDNSSCFSIGSFHWDKKEAWFDFRSCGTRYLSFREDGLESWLLAWCELKKIEIEFGE